MTRINKTKEKLDTLFNKPTHEFDLNDKHFLAHNLRDSLSSLESTRLALFELAVSCGPLFQEISQFYMEQSRTSRLLFGNASLALERADLAHEQLVGKWFALPVPVPSSDHDIKNETLEQTLMRIQANILDVVKDLREYEKRVGEG